MSKHNFEEANSKQKLANEKISNKHENVPKVSKMTSRAMISNFDLFDKVIENDDANGILQRTVVIKIHLKLIECLG